MRGAIANAKWKGWLLSWLPVLFCMGLIFYGSSRVSLPRPIEEPAPNGELYRQLLHVLEYAVLTGCLYRALAYRKRRQPRPAAAREPARASGRPSLLGIVVALGLLHAVFDEVHQGFVPNRDPSIRDIVADAAGVALALAVIALVSLVLKRPGASGQQGGLKIVVILPARARARSQGMPEKQP